MCVFRLVAIVSVLGMTAACGGSGATTKAQDKFIARIDSGIAQTKRVNNLPGTAFSAMPANGSAVFVGVAEIFIDPVFERDDDDIFILGKSRLTANFGARTVKGSITNMQAATNMNVRGPFGDFDLVPVKGTVRVGNASLIGNDLDDNSQNRPNEWYADYAGDLTIKGDVYKINGALRGEFRGTRVNPAAGKSTVKAIVGESVTGVGFKNGSLDDLSVSVGIAGEN
jgi:hypothetical protein